MVSIGRTFQRMPLHLAIIRPIELIPQTQLERRLNQSFRYCPDRGLISLFICLMPNPVGFL